MDTQIEMDLAKGKAGRDIAMNTLEATRSDWLHTARYIARDICERQGHVCADDIHRRFPPPSGVDPRVMGAVFSGKGWVRLGYKQSERPACHARPIPIWGLQADD